MSTVTEEMQQRTQSQQHERQCPKQVRAVLAQEKKRGNREETQQRQARARTPEGFPLLPMMFVIHDVLRMSERLASSSGRNARRASHQA